jgi:hypothetical protein
LEGRNVEKKKRKRMGMFIGKMKNFYCLVNNKRIRK